MAMSRSLLFIPAKVSKNNPVKLSFQSSFKLNTSVNNILTIFSITGIKRCHCICRKLHLETCIINLLSDLDLRKYTSLNHKYSAFGIPTVILTAWISIFLQFWCIARFLEEEFRASVWNRFHPSVVRNLESYWFLVVIPANKTSNAWGFDLLTTHNL